MFDDLISLQFQVQIMEESLAYTFINLVAEFGGYLGILMGASILSLYEFILDL